MDAEVLAWTTFVIALVGAGAWVPTILRWLAVPDLQIVPGSSLEVSYMEYGGVLNLPCAFASFNKPALIESLSLTLQHEGGHVIDMYCVGLSESTLAQSSTGENVSWGRQSRVNTLAVGADESQERLVLFRDAALKEPLRDLFRRIVPLVNRLKAAVGEGWPAEMVKTEEYDRWLRTVRDGQQWRQGRYNAELLVTVRQLREQQRLKFSFVLSEADTGGMQANVDSAVEFVSRSLTHTDAAGMLTRPQYVFAMPDLEVG